MGQEPMCKGICIAAAAGLGQMCLLLGLLYLSAVSIRITFYVLFVSLVKRKCSIYWQALNLENMI